MSTGGVCEQGKLSLHSEQVASGPEGCVAPSYLWLSSCQLKVEEVSAQKDNRWNSFHVVKCAHDMMQKRV